MRGWLSSKEETKSEETKSESDESYEEEESESDDEEESDEEEESASDEEHEGEGGANKVATWSKRLQLPANPAYVGGNDGIHLDSGLFWGGGTWLKSQAQEESLWARLHASDDKLGDYPNLLARLVAYHQALIAARNEGGFSYKPSALDWNIELNQTTCRTRGEGGRSKGGMHAAAFYAFTLSHAKATQTR